MAGRLFLWNKKFSSLIWIFLRPVGYRSLCDCSFSPFASLLHQDGRLRGLFGVACQTDFLYLALQFRIDAALYLFACLTRVSPRVGTSNKCLSLSEQFQLIYVHTYRVTRSTSEFRFRRNHYLIYNRTNEGGKK